MREVAKVNQWESSSDLKPQLDNAERELDLYWKAKLGINPQLMMPGNYARVMFDPSNASCLLDLITDRKKRESLGEVLDLFRQMRTVYRANNPTQNFQEEVRAFEINAVKMGRKIIENFEYARWSNYLHKIIEHTQELIQEDDGIMSVGALSGEGNEAGNKLFRLFRKNPARKGKTMHGLIDVLILHWLYSSPKLRGLAEVYHKQTRCTNCHELGHNLRTCKIPDVENSQ